AAQAARGRDRQAIAPLAGDRRPARAHPAEQRRAASGGAAAAAGNGTRARRRGRQVVAEVGRTMKTGVHDDSLTALVVDDQATARERMTTILADAGWRVSTAGSAAEALEKARA